MVDYANMTLDQFVALTLEEYAGLPLESSPSGDDSGGGTTSGECPNTAVIASILTAVESLQTAVSALQTDVTTIKARVNAIPTQTYTVPTVSQIQSGLATASALSTLQTSVDAIPTATYSVPTVSDVWNHETRTLTQDFPTMPTIPSVAEIQEGLAKTSELPDVSNLATVSDLAEVSAHGDENWKTAEITLEGDVTVNVNYETLSESVWGYGNRTLTGHSPTTPEEVQGSAYCNRQDVERRWGIANVHQWADLENDNDSAKVQTQIDWAILSATSRIENDLASSLYVLPFSPVPVEVRKHAAGLAGVELFNCRSMAATNSNPVVERAETEYQNWLTAVLSGISISGAQTIS